MYKALTRKQNEDYKVIQVDDLDLEFLQQSVGGYIERVAFDEEFNRRNIDMWINEEGKFNGNFKPTFIVVEKEEPGKILDIIMGDVVFTSSNEEGETIGLNDVQIQYIKSKLSKVAVLNDGTIANIIEI